MQKNKNSSSTICVAGLVMSTAVTAAGAGFDLPDLDAFAVGRGMAFVATADNPSAIYFNPAGITQLPGNNFRGGIYGIYLDPSFKSPSGSTYYNQAKLHALPQFYYTYNHKGSPFTFGLGVYTPFGLGSEWPQNSGFRTVTGGLNSSITYVTFNPVVALKCGPTLSVAAGLSANYAEGELKQGLVDPAPDSDSLEFKGSGWAVGYNLGVLWQPIRQLSFGSTFRGSSKNNLQGHTDATFPLALGGGGYNSSASAQFNFPLEAVFGASYRPTTNWNIEFDAEYMDWDSMKSITINQPGAVFLPTTLNVPLDWQSSWYFEWGATRYFCKKWHVSGGFIFSEGSVPNTFYTPAVADTDRYFLSLGAGYTWKQFDVDVAYQFGFGPGWVVNNATPTTAGQTADGKFTFYSQAIAVSAGWHF